MVCISSVEMHGAVNRGLNVVIHLVLILEVHVLKSENDTLYLGQDTDPTHVSCH